MIHHVLEFCDADAMNFSIDTHHEVSMSYSQSRQHIAQLEKFAEYCQDYVSHLLLLLIEGHLWYVHYNF